MITDTIGTPRKRPLGITIITILIVVTAILQLVPVVLAPITHTLTLSAILLQIVFAIINLVIAWGLWQLKRWAFWLVVIFQSLTLLSCLFALNSIANIVEVIISLAILLYLFLDRNVRIAFRETVPPPQPIPPIPGQ